MLNYLYIHIPRPFPLVPYSVDYSMDCFFFYFHIFVFFFVAPNLPVLSFELKVLQS